MNDDEPQTLAECYASATTSKRLTVEPGRCDIDYLMAAGWSGSALGASLMRLRAEFDAIHAQVGNNPSTTDAFVLRHLLRSLPAVRDGFAETAVKSADAWGYLQPASVVLAIAGRVLDAWLDPRCSPCEGRGFNGGTHRGEQRITCRACSGSGDRRVNLGDAPQDKRLAAQLLDLLAGELRGAEEGMRHALRPAGLTVGA